MHRKAFRSDLNFLVNGKVVKARKVELQTKLSMFHVSWFFLLPSFPRPIWCLPQRHVGPRWSEWCDFGTLALERLWLRTCTLKSLAICMLEIVAYNGIMDDFTMIFIEIQFTDLHHRDWVRLLNGPRRPKPPVLGTAATVTSRSACEVNWQLLNHQTMQPCRLF